MTDEQLRRLRSALEGARRTASHTAGDVYLQGVRDGLSEALEILTGQP